jgi:hypothetical protein
MYNFDMGTGVVHERPRKKKESKIGAWTVRIARFKCVFFFFLVAHFKKLPHGFVSGKTSSIAI